MQGTVSASQWNQAKERSMGKDRTAQELNYYIESTKSRLYQIHRELEIEGKLIFDATARMNLLDVIEN